MNFTNENVLKARKNNRIFFMIGLVCILIVLTILVLSIIKDKNIKSFEDTIGLDNPDDVHAYINVSKISPSIGSYEDYEAFYLVSDNNYMYVVYLPNYLYREIDNMDLSIKPYRLEGRLEVIPKDVKDAIIDIYKDSDFILNEDNFNDYFSYYYLNQKIESYIDANMIIIISFGVAGIIVLIIGLYFMFKFNSGIKKLSMTEISKLEGEMSSSDAIFYKKINLYLTRNYIITMNGKFKYYKYEDILWLYIKTIKYKNIPVSDNIMILTSDNKLLNIASARHVSKKEKNSLRDIMNKIVEKNPNIKLGYTKENKQYFKELKKEMKNK